jgi:hypothetical protein
MTSNPASFTMTRAERVENCGFGPTAIRIVASPAPLVGFSVIHAASTRAAHSHSRADATVIVAVAPTAGMVDASSEAATEHRSDDGPNTVAPLVAPPQAPVASRPTSAMVGQTPSSAVRNRLTRHADALTETPLLQRTRQQLRADFRQESPSHLPNVAVAMAGRTVSALVDTPARPTAAWLRAAGTHELPGTPRQSRPTSHPTSQCSWVSNQGSAGYIGS